MFSHFAYIVFYVIQKTKASSSASVEVLCSAFSNATWASLVVQWLRICLPMQRTWVRALVREDPTCRRATKPVRHNYWACTLESVSHNYWALCHNYWSPHAYSPCSATREATAIRSPRTAMKSSPCWPQLKKAPTQQQRPNAAKNK